VNTLKISAPPLIYDIETLMVYMMDSAPTYLAELMTSEFNQGYLAGFVLASIDHQQAEIEAREENTDDQE
jgi:hypothetical protein